MYNSKNIIVTGASDGIGKSTAIELAKNEYDLILLGRNKSQLNLVKNECLKSGSKNVSIYSFDISDYNAVKKFIKKISNQNIFGIINCAGIWQKKADLENIPDDEILEVLNIDLTGLIMLTKGVLPLLKKPESAFIINVSSRSGYIAQQGQSIYSAAKFGVRGFSEVLREDLINTNVRVCTIYQGGTNTQMFNKAGEGFSDEKLSTFIKSEELAKVLVFLVNRPKGIWLPEIKIETK